MVIHEKNYIICEDYIETKIIFRIIDSAFITFHSNIKNIRNKTSSLKKHLPLNFNISNVWIYLYFSFISIAKIRYQLRKKEHNANVL